MKKYMNKLLGVINTLALSLVFQNVNGICVWLIYQPEIPPAAMRLKL